MKKWVRNGLIGIGVLVIIYVLGLVANIFNTIGIYLSLNFLIGPIQEKILGGSDANLLRMLIATLPVIILWFVYGIVIGWIYGKIKSNSK